MSTFVNMAASRIGSTYYICRKYQFFFYVTFFFVGLQLFLAYNFYSGRQADTIELENWKKRVVLLDNYNGPGEDPLPHENPPKHRANPKVVGVASYNASRASRVVDRHKKLMQDISQNILVSKGNTSAHVVNKNEVPYTPKCVVQGKDAISAIQRASTEQCKQGISDAYCLLKENKLYPTQLPRYCPLKDTNGGEYLGCYRDDRNKRILDGHKSDFRSDNEPNKCINHCLRLGFQLAGVEYSYECFCGNSLSKTVPKLEEVQCDTPCPGQRSAKCGGFQAISVFHTGYGKPASNPNVYIRPDNVPPDSWTPRVAFVLTVTGRALRQIKRLLKAIYHVQHYYYIHVDKRQEYLFRELTALAEGLPNMRIAESRFSTIWGGASLLTMHLQCMRDLLAMDDWHWDFFINLSESDYPIKSISQLEAYLGPGKKMNFVRNHGTKTSETLEEIIAYLSVQNKKNFVRSHGKDTNRFIRKQGLNMLFYECDTHMWRLGERALQDGIRVDGGSDWFCLNRDFAKYVTESKDDLVTGLKAYWTYALLPAESFFHTVIQNSEHCVSWVNNNLHLTNWNRKQGCKCQYKHVVDWCGCSPNDFMPRDFAKIKSQENRPIYFARKFEAIINQEIINELDAYLFGQYPEDMLGLNSYWQNDYHYQDVSTRVEDPIVSVYHSFTRLGAQHLLDSTSSGPCTLTPVRLLEVHLYNHADTFMGLLVKFEATTASGDLQMFETFVQEQRKYRVLKLAGPITRLKYIEVGTTFDPKEEVFRNFANLIGPNSDIKLKMNWGPGAAKSFTVAYIDPANVLAASYEVPVKESETDEVQVHSPDFSKPLRPGMWTVKILFMWEVVAETQFLVLPVTHTDGQLYKTDQKGINVGPPGNKYTAKDFNHLKDSLRIFNNDTKVKMEQAEANSLRRGYSLLQWADDLTSIMWRVTETCVAEADSETACSSASVCQHTKWSSFSPDPKSEIKQVNKSTGRIR